MPGRFVSYDGELCVWKDRLPLTVPATRWLAEGLAEVLGTAMLTAVGSMSGFDPSYSDALMICNFQSHLPPLPTPRAAGGGGGRRPAATPARPTVGGGAWKGRRRATAEMFAIICVTRLVHQSL